MGTRECQKKLSVPVHVLLVELWTVNSFLEVAGILGEKCRLPEIKLDKEKEAHVEQTF